MEITIGVLNFGKIESAEITLGDFTMFVGNNNSGKTFMMQLMYGVLKEIFKMDVTDKGMIQNGDCEEFGLEWMKAWESQINTYLNKNKQQIVIDIFHNPVAIEKLYVKFTGLSHKYVCHMSDWKYEDYEEIPEEKGEEEDNAVILKKGKKARIYSVSLVTGEKKKEEEINFFLAASNGVYRSFIMNWIKKDMLGWGNQGREAILFLPASRTGLLLLYKYFFSEKNKMDIEELPVFLRHKRRKDNEEAGNELGLAAPVYDFLQFLLRYTPNRSSRVKNKELLQFMEKYMLEGKIGHVGDDTFYIPKETETSIPLYLASSLINEMAPIVKALSGAANYKYMFYDEVETCLHPMKQGEMARLLMRLVNSGRRMIVSTHSDTMAAKINNLLLLSKSKEDENIQEKLKKLKLSDSDLLQDAKVHVYQFVNGKNGKSIASELEFKTAPFVGYDFSLFADNLDNLFHESEIILE